jgi:hypothetical protein
MLCRVPRTDSHQEIAVVLSAVFTAPTRQVPTRVIHKLDLDTFNMLIGCWVRRVNHCWGCSTPPERLRLTYFNFTRKMK